MAWYATVCSHILCGDISRFCRDDVAVMEAAAAEASGFQAGLLRGGVGVSSFNPVSLRVTREDEQAFSQPALRQHLADNRSFPFVLW